MESTLVAPRILMMTLKNIITKILLLLALPLSTFAAKPEIFIMRGLIRGNANSVNFIKAFNQQLSNDAILHGLEVHGNGKYYQLPSATSIDEMVEQVRADYLNAIQNETAKRYLIAISMGGMIATRWLEKYPNDFEKVALVNTSFSNACHWWERLRIQNVWNYIKIALPTSAQSKEEAIFDMIIANQDQNKHLISEWTKIREAQPIGLMNTIRQIWSASTFSPSSHKPKTQAHIDIIVGLKDELVDPKCSLNIAKMWNITPIQHPLAGHDLTNDDSQWTINYIQENFLK